jgi:Acyl-CoA reductase (LuxC)
MSLPAASALPGSENATVRVNRITSLSTSDFESAIERLREALGQFPGSGPTAEALAATFERWRDRSFTTRAAAIAQIAARSGMSRELLDESIDALVMPFGRDTLGALARSVVTRAMVGGFVMPANVPGAGLHELVCALVAGAVAMVKTSSREPVFFDAFVRTLRELAPEIGARARVVGFGRERTDLADLLRTRSDFVVALGDDPATAAFSRAARHFAFPSRVSGALVAREVLSARPPGQIAAALARDVALFEQLGCLSPHHVFVEEMIRGAARAFAGDLAHALFELARRLAPTRLPFQSAASIRRVREAARWRGLGGGSVELMEGAAMGWTVIFDPDARFSLSPGYRTVYVTAVRDPADLKSRLAPVSGRLEAFALAVSDRERARWTKVLAALGVSYVCAPGMMQSPPLAWRHGGGAFLDFVTVA